MLQSEILRVYSAFTSMLVIRPLTIVKLVINELQVSVNDRTINVTAPDGSWMRSFRPLYTTKIWWCSYRWDFEVVWQVLSIIARWNMGLILGILGTFMTQSMRCNQNVTSKTGAGCTHSYLLLFSGLSGYWCLKLNVFMTVCQCGNNSSFFLQ